MPPFSLVISETAVDETGQPILDPNGATIQSPRTFWPESLDEARELFMTHPEAKIFKHEPDLTAPGTEVEPAELLAAG